VLALVAAVLMFFLATYLYIQSCPDMLS